MLASHKLFISAAQQHLAGQGLPIIEANDHTVTRRSR